MKATVIAAALLFSSASLLAQVPNIAGAPNIPTRTPTRPAGAAPGSGAPPPVLHVDGHVTSLGCGKPLEFDIVVKNTSGSPFAGGANLRISGNGLNHPPQLEGSVHAGVGPIAANASQTLHFMASPVKVDCVAPQTFVMTLTPGVNNLQPHPQWDRDALELTTAPPTNCSATGGSARQPNWSPKV